MQQMVKYQLMSWEVYSEASEKKEIAFYCDDQNQVQISRV